jgi:putative effector of murein hydrolase LrgA (UPF0299 family)
MPFFVWFGFCLTTTTKIGKLTKLNLGGLVLLLLLLLVVVLKLDRVVNGAVVFVDFLVVPP